MKDAHDAALDQRPDVLDAVHMHPVLHVGLGMIHGLMGKLRAVQPEVRSELVGMHLRSRVDILPNEVCEGTF